MVIAICVFLLFLRYQLGELGGVQCLYLGYTAHSCVLYWRPGLYGTIGGDFTHILGQISRIINPEDSRYGFSLYLHVFIVCNLLQNVVFKIVYFSKTFSVGLLETISLCG